MSGLQIKNRIEKLQRLMKTEGIAAYIVPTADFHQSEYVGAHFKTREFLTGFTGSAGTAVIMEKSAYLWTDGRYFIQAAAQLENTGIHLMKSGEEGVPKITEFLESELSEDTVIAFDGRTVGVKQGKEFEKIAMEKGGAVCYDRDLAGETWQERPPISEEPAFALDLCYAGESISSKLTRIREKMAEKHADALLLTGLDDIDWMLNIRGRDVAYFPLLLSYAIVKKDVVEWYVDERKIDAAKKSEIMSTGIQLYNYDDIYEHLKQFPEGMSVWLDPRQVNYALYRNLPGHTTVIEEGNPLIPMKAVKNETEIKNIRAAHLKDGIAHTKFMYWLKQNIGKERITEISASQKLEELRREQGDFVSPSFDPICAYREHAAIVHYSATEESNAELKAEGLFLTDTGGNYLQGSTDITRTVALGRLTDEEKLHFTTVVSSMLRLADAVFLRGSTGMTLDYAAREPFWRRRLNFNHGTGHGVGYLGNIHEPPQRFQWKYSEEGSCALEKNMVITDEPGLYIEGSHGIRIENELLVCEDIKNEYGQFLRFEHLTYVPIDLDAVETAYMTESEKQLLNDYHKNVYEKIAPFLTEEEQKWLKIYTREIN